MPRKYPVLPDFILLDTAVSGTFLEAPPFTKVTEELEREIVGLLTLAEQETEVAQLVQLQVQGPEPLTEEAVPGLHKFVVGLESKVEPLDDPQTGADTVVLVTVKEAVLEVLPPALVQVRV